MNDSGCTKTVSVRGLRTEGLPFSSIPSQSKLFIKYLEDPLVLREFYPSAVERHTDAASRVDDVLAAYRTDRNLLCDALIRINEGFGSGAPTRSNIEVLREPGTVAILTGQQTGLFTGPLYSIYKALSAVKMAECMSDRGVRAVPVFWMATEDHDLAEVSNSFGLDNAGNLFESTFRADPASDGLPVGRVSLGGSIDKAIAALFAELPATEFTAELRERISDAWEPGATFGQAFGRSLTQMLGKYGIIVVDPMDPAIKRLASAIYVEGIRRSKDIVEALVRRSRALTDAGYHAQVLVEDDHFPLFWHADDGTRTALRRGSDGALRAKGKRTTFSLEELAAAASDEPESFSPGVMLRPVVQDWLFPTLCYFGGAAEVAYFAQNSEVYRILDRPVTTILHRQSFTVVEAKHSRTLDRYGLRLADLFDGEEAVLTRVVDEFVDRDTATLFTEAEKQIAKELDRLEKALSGIDVTLVGDLATRRRKILYHIAAIRKKYHRRRAEIDETIDRRVMGMFTALLPQGALQERTLNIVSFLDRFGPNFIDWLYESVDLSDKDHRIIYL